MEPDVLLHLQFGSVYLSPMPSLVLPVQKRSLSERPRDLRNSGRIPAISYGRGKDSLPLTVDYQGFRKIFEKAGESTIVELEFEGKKIPVLVHDVQYDPVSDHITHVDFYLVDMAKEVTTKVPVKCIGLAPAVKNLGGILTVHKHEITIRCLPKDLISVIEIDVTSLDNFHSSIHVRDLKVPSVLKVLDHAEDTVVNVRPPKVEEEVKPVEAAAPGAEAIVPGAAAPAAAGAGAPTAAGKAPAAPAEKKEKK